LELAPIGNGSLLHAQQLAITMIVRPARQLDVGGVLQQVHVQQEHIQDQRLDIAPIGNSTIIYAQ